VTSVTLVELMAEKYTAQVKKCSYKNGKLLDKYPTTIITKGGEAMPIDKQYDTVVMINVLEHCQDAFKVLENLYVLVKPAGYLVFHDKVWDKYTGVPPGNKASDKSHFTLHPIRVKTPLIESFLTHFEQLYHIQGKESAELVRRKQDGIYFIGKRPLSGNTFSLWQVSPMAPLTAKFTEASAPGESVPETRDAAEHINTQAMSWLGDAGCQNKATQFFEKCFCQPGWSGDTFEEKWPSATPTCDANSDKFFYHPEYSTALVMMKRWQKV
jgi:SAM-dependent methyltransferase